MSIQNIIDKAQQIEIDRRRVVGQTLSRSQRLKTSERSSAQPWKFKVTPPAQLSWTTSRSFIEEIDTNDRVTETEVTLNNNAGMSYITAYQGQLTQAQLNTMTISSTGTSTLVIGSLPSIGATLTSRSYAMTAKSFAALVSEDYNRALSSSRTDFLISNTEFDQHFYSIQVGDTLSATTYITGGQTIASITRNYITLSGIGYTRIVMSAVANASSTSSTVTGDEDILVTASKTTTVSSSTVVFNKGDIVQPANSRYPYSISNTVVRGSGSTVSLTLNRPVITSEGVTLTGQTIKVGNSCSWRVVVVGLPTYTLIPGQRVQYNGDFELVEKII